MAEFVDFNVSAGAAHPQDFKYQDFKYQGLSTCKE
jgi:hypothetical protein